MRAEMKLLAILVIVALVASVLGAGCGPGAGEDEYREAFNSGVEYFNEGKEYLSDAETLVRLGNLDEAALAASRAQGKFRSAANHFHEAYQIATEHGIGADVPPTPQQEKSTPNNTVLTIEEWSGPPLIAFDVEIHPPSKAWNNWKLSLELEHQSGGLVDGIVEAKQAMAQQAAVLELIGFLLSLLPLLL